MTIDHLLLAVGVTLEVSIVVAVAVVLWAIRRNRGRSS